MNIKMTVLAGVVAAAASGCYTLDVRTAGAVPAGDSQSMHGVMFMWGLVGADVVSPCPPATIESEEGFVGTLVSWLTLGLVTPWSVEVTCAAPGAYAPAAYVPRQSAAPPAPPEQSATPTGPPTQPKALCDQTHWQGCGK